MATVFCVGAVKFRGVTALPDLLPERIDWGAYAEYDGWRLFAGRQLSPRAAIARIIKEAQDHGADIKPRHRNRIYRRMLRAVESESLKGKQWLRNYSWESFTR